MKYVDIPGHFFRKRVVWTRQHGDLNRGVVYIDVTRGAMDIGAAHNALFVDSDVQFQ